MKTSSPKKTFAALGAVALMACVFCAAAASGASVYDIRDFGATGDGKTPDTAAFAKAVESAFNAGGGTVVAPPGRYLTGTIKLKSHVTLHVEAGAIILGSENPDDYPLTQNVWSIDPAPSIRASLIYAEDSENITITGRGTIDGQGQVWWERVRYANPAKYKLPPLTDYQRAEVAKISHERPRLIRMVRCRDILIENVHLQNSAAWTVNFQLCDYIRVEGISITNPPKAPNKAHNSDGINPESCSNVRIANCRIDTGDDCITLKSGKDEAGRRVGKPTENVTITNCVIYHGHGGVVIGSEMSGGVRNVTVSNCVFNGTDNGIRIKSQRGRGGVVEGLNVSNIVMHAVPTPFIITTFYTGSDTAEDEHAVDEGTPRYRNFMFSNISARGARIAGAITGLKEMPIENIIFSNVRIQAGKGFTCANARDITFLDTVIDTNSGPSLILKNSTEINTSGLRTRKPHKDIPLIAK
jgi:polygalacturonase